jgi:hypothetical protein
MRIPNDTKVLFNPALATSSVLCLLEKNGTLHVTPDPGNYMVTQGGLGVTCENHNRDTIILTSDSWHCKVEKKCEKTGAH